MDKPECRIRVIVTRDDGTVIHDRIGDHNDADFRQWMGKTAFWAMRNEHGMTSFPASWKVDVK